MSDTRNTGEAIVLRDAYAAPADMATALAKRLQNTLVIIRLEETLLVSGDVDTPTPYINVALERILSMFPNCALVANAPKAKIIDCLKRAGLLSHFYQDSIFGTDGLDAQQLYRGHLYLQVPEQAGYFRENVLVIEGTDAGMREAKRCGLKTLRFNAANPAAAPDSFASAADFIRVWGGRHGE